VDALEAGDLLGGSLQRRGKGGHGSVQWHLEGEATVGSHFSRLDHPVDASSASSFATSSEASLTA
jgi:hypothetical protein